MPILGNLGFGNFGFTRKPILKSISWSPSPAASESTDGNFTILTVTSSATLTVTGAAPISHDFLMVAQGGSPGGPGYGGGGGSGGMVYATSKTISPGTYPVVVGSNVTFNGYTSLAGGPGGGTGGHDPDGTQTAGRPGGSGGGCGRAGGGIGVTRTGGTALQPTQPQPSPVTQYGGDGAGPNAPRQQWGGGGAGGNASLGNGGAGQANSITGTSITYAAGQPVSGAYPAGGGPHPGSANPSTPGRGGGGSIPGSLIIRYQKTLS